MAGRGRRRLLGDRVDPPQAAAIATLRLIPFSRPALWGTPLPILTPRRGVGARLNAAWQAGTSVSSSPMFFLPCSRWVPGATPLGDDRLPRRRVERRNE